MTERVSTARLGDIVEAIEIIAVEMTNMTLAAFEQDRRKRSLVERGIEIISEASRHIGPELKTRHQDIPWPKVAGIGNVLRHDYARVAHDVLWHVVRNDLPLLQCRAELAAKRSRLEYGVTDE